jgi:ethanolamine-phosphate cytidylyltransferase
MVRYYRGDKYPLMCLQERLLMVLACKHVDDIVIEAPYIITEDLVRSLNISKVVNVVTDEDLPLQKHADVDQF